jgi:hypothetical protein
VQGGRGADEQARVRVLGLVDDVAGGADLDQLTVL